MIRIRSVARHKTAKADDRVRERVVDNYYNSRSVNYVSQVCCVLCLRSLRLLRTFSRTFLHALRWMETPLHCCVIKYAAS